MSLSIVTCELCGKQLMSPPEFFKLKRSSDIISCEKCYHISEEVHSFCSKECLIKYIEEEILK